MITTQRLELAPLTLDEGRAVLRGDREGRRWARDYPADGDLEIARLLVPPSAFGPRQIVVRSADLVVGGIGFFGPPDERGQVGVGYGVTPAWQGRGIATEALRGLIGFAREHPSVRRVVADTAVDNVASQRVLERAGMRRVASDNRLHHYALEL